MHCTTSHMDFKFRPPANHFFIHCCYSQVPLDLRSWMLRIVWRFDATNLKFLDETSGIFCSKHCKSRFISVGIKIHKQFLVYYYAHPPQHDKRIRVLWNVTSVPLQSNITELYACRHSSFFNDVFWNIAIFQNTECLLKYFCIGVG